MKGRFGLLVLVAALLAAWGCRSPLDPDSSATTGSLILSFGKELTARTLLPDISLDIHRYEVNGVGPRGATFSFTTEEREREVPGLAFGWWSVYVQALNADGLWIGTGEGTAVVRSNDTTRVSIPVAPLQGTGSLELAVLWNEQDVDIPEVTGQLIPAAGEAVDIDFDIVGATAAAQLASVPTGYHTLVLQLLDNGYLTTGAVEVVRIAKGAATRGTFKFLNINKPGGKLQVAIVPEMAEPLEVSIAGHRQALVSGEQMALTASVPPAVGNVVYVWYVNGAGTAVGPDFSFSKPTAGIYRIDVTAFTIDGKRAGSASVMTTVVASDDLLAEAALIYGAGDGIEQRYPTVAVDAAVAVHVAFTDHSLASNAVYLYSSNGFGEAAPLGYVTTGFGEGCSLAVDEATGKIHALLPTIGGGHGYDFHYSTSDDWDRRVRITSLDEVDGRHEMFGEIAAAGGVAHALWRWYNQEDGQPRGYAIQYGNSLNWHAWEYVRLPIWGTLDAWGPGVGEPAMALDELGTVHAAWSDAGQANRLVYANSGEYMLTADPDPLSPAGSMRRVWTNKPTNIADNYRSFDIAASGGTVYLVHANEDLFIYRSTDAGASWVTVAQVHVPSLTFRNSKAVYREGKLHIGALAGTGTEWSLYYLCGPEYRARKILLPSGFDPITASEGRNRNFDYRDGRAYFVWANTLPPAYDYDVALAVVSVGP